LFSPDGRKILTASSDCTARTWDATSGYELLAFRGHTKAVGNAVFGRDGSTVLTKSFGETAARIWDASTGEELLALHGHDDVIESAVFSPDSTRVLTASSDCTSRIWNATTGEQATVLRGHYDRIRLALFSPNGSRVLTISSDESVRLWEASSHVVTTEQGGHQACIKGIVFNVDGSRMVSTAINGVARIWDTVSGNYCLNINDSLGALFSPDGKIVLVTSTDGSVKFLDSESGTVLFVLSLWSDRIQSSRFSPDGTKVLTKPYSRKLARLWDSATGVELPISREYDQWIWDSEHIHQQESQPVSSGVIASDCYRRGVRICNGLAIVQVWIQLDSFINVCSVLPTDPLSFVAGCADGSVRFYRLEGVELPSG
jgi:WD40 repeat protein